MPLAAQPIDPRDVGSIQTNPTYRVYFVDADRATDEWSLAGADNVSDVLDWARAHAAGRDFSAFVQIIDARGVRLIRLMGNVE